MRSQLNSYLDLPRPERAFLLQAGLPLIAVAAMLRLGGLDTSLRLLRRRLPPPLPVEPIPLPRIDEARRMAELIKIAARRLPVNATCLRQSVLIWWLLRRQRLPATLRLGVARTQGFQAHAWVEIDGTVVNDSGDVARRFAVLHETTGRLGDAPTQPPAPNSASRR